MKNKNRKIRCGRNKASCNARPAVAMLVVLFIVMAITVLTVGYLTSSDTALSAAENTKMRIELDYLAESGLEHARGLLLYPKGVDLQGNNYWMGASGQQLLSGDDYYDVNVSFTDINDANSYYSITITAYREVDSVRIAESIMSTDIPLNIPTEVKYWKLDDGSGTTVTDSSTNNISGSWQGSGLAWSTGLFSGALEFGTAGSLPTPSGTIILYGNGNYGGWAAEFSDVGTYYAADIIAAGGQGNDTESIRVPDGYKVTLYEHDPPGGSTVVRLEDDDRLPPALKDNVSSLKIEFAAPVILYGQFNYYGWAAGFNEVGTYYTADIITAGGGDNLARAIRIFPGIKVTLYDYSPPGGASEIKTSSDDDLEGFSDMTSSLAISVTDHNGHTTGNAAPSLTTGSATVSLWVRIPISYEAWAPIAVLVCANNDYELAIDDSAQLFIAHVDSGGSNYLAGPLTTAINDDQWHHVLFTLNSTDSEVKLYVDGELGDTGTSYSDNIDVAQFYLGCRNQSPSVYYLGKIDEVKVYDAILNQIQIDYLASQGP